MSRNCSNLYSWNTLSSVLDDIRRLISFDFVFVWMPTGSMSVYFYSPTTVQIPAICYQILPFRSYWHHIEGKYIKALSHPASWRADRPKHIAAEGDGARVRKTTRSSRWGGGGRRRGELERCWNRDDVRKCVKRGEEDPRKRVRVGVGGGGCTQRQTKNIKRQCNTQEREQRL